MDFNTAFDRTLSHEGHYTDGKDDPGGETNWGISKRAYPNIDIRNLTREGAREIYKRDFWDRIGLEDNVPDGVTYQLFDFAVNSSIETTIRYFQRALGVADDGHFGPVSYAAMRKATETDMIMRLNAERLDYMTRLKNWSINSKGWTRRIANNLRYGAEDS